MRFNVYIDGHNLYNGCLKDGPYRWLDVRKLARLELPGHTVCRVRYFSARIIPPPHDPSRSTRQDIYLRALKTIPGVEIDLGKFLQHKEFRTLASAPAGGPTEAEVLLPQEKGTDVKIACAMLMDAFGQDCEALALVSNDSDLCEPVRLVRDHFKLPIYVLAPSLRPGRTVSSSLGAVCTRIRPVSEAALAGAQLPTFISEGKRTIYKPPSWT